MTPALPGKVAAGIPGPGEHLSRMSRFAPIQVTLPDWVEPFLAGQGPWPDDHARMGLAIALAAENVRRGTGGPFGAAIFERGTGRLVAVGVNNVVRLNNSTLHAEMMAFMFAEAAVGSYSLGGDGRPAHELFTSCEPCAMCLGGTLWSGVTRVVCGATRDDAHAARFDEGPVFHASHVYLRERGIELVFGVRREEAAAVLAAYHSGGGVVY